MKEVLKFSRVGCNPCKTLTFFLNDKDVEYRELDVDDDAQLAVQYGVGGVPTLLLVEDGEVIDRVVGFNPYAVEDLLARR